MMKTVARGGVPSIPGMGPMGGKPGASSKRGNKQKKGGGSRSGNPAKRAAENAGLAAQAPSGSGFGLGAAPQPRAAELAEIQKLFGKG
jgi:signal recognition particle subunit SRP54